MIANEEASPGGRRPRDSGDREFKRDVLTFSFRRWEPVLHPIHSHALSRKTAVLAQAIHHIDKAGEIGGLDQVRIGTQRVGAADIGAFLR